MKNLSIRERAIITYSANGNTAKEIAQKIGLEYRTIESYVATIKRKLGAKNITHAVYLAYRENLMAVHQHV